MKTQALTEDYWGILGMRRVYQGDQLENLRGREIAVLSEKRTKTDNPAVSAYAPLC